MKSGAKAKYLVVDTTGFIKNFQFQDLAENVITLEDVVNEVKCHRQLKRLAVLPYDLIMKCAFPENIKTVSEFSKKTGDYPNLSAVDMKVLALTYQLEKEYVGTDHLNTTPKMQTTIENCNPADIAFDKIVGFHNKDEAMDKIDGQSLAGDSELITHNMKALEVSDEINKDDIVNKETSSEVILSDSLPSEEIKNNAQVSEESVSGVPVTSIHNDCFESTAEKTSKCIEKEEMSESPPDDNIELGYSSDDEGDSLGSDGNNDDGNDLNFNDLSRTDDLMVLKRIDESTLEHDEVSEDDSIYDDDDCGWITPSNIAQAKRETYSGLLSDEPVTVACLTSDFAMQNVLLQMGLQVMSVDGRIIKQLRTYILRCHACGKTTSIMTKIFCPKCGLKTLKRVGVSVDSDGTQHLYINYKRQITARGKRWSIPKPQGGRQANNPILVEDQRVPQQRLSKKALQKTNAFDPNYIAGFSPFVTRDTTSRSIMLGFHTSRQNAKNLIGRNPHKKQGKKKK